MQRVLTIVMYHYVRDLKRSRYPEIKGLDKAKFEEQIAYIKKHYCVIGGAELMDAIIEHDELPPRPLLLTFDDGYIDHFTDVLPILRKESLPGCFFPPAKPILEHQVLDVNKIHFVLASTADTRKLVEYIFKEIDINRDRYGLLSSEAYWEKVAKPNRYDPAAIVFCKEMLQRELPGELRKKLIDEMFGLYVTRDETSFATELYMSIEQVRSIQSEGMYVGSHGYDHVWLNTLSPPQQEQEIDQSLRFLNAVGASEDRWIMCYPYGAYDESLITILKSRNCIAGLTTEVGVAQIHSDPFTLPRLDTNDLPKDSNATANEWTIQAC